MIIIDSALERRQAEDNPIRVAMVGAGFMGRGIALQILSAVQGMDLVAISSRHLEGARRAYAEAGLDDVRTVRSADELAEAVFRCEHAITEDPSILCEAEGIDAILEVTGTVEYAADVALKAIANHKHFIAMNAELDGTLGPILKVRADQEGVVFSNADGDQPGVLLNLYRFVQAIGVRPVMCGSIKGLHDPYRNPTTQEGFARQWGQKPSMVTSFADGTKISFEQAIVANATGMRVAQRGMRGPVFPAGTPVQQTIDWFPQEELTAGPGIIDYVVGATPSPGVFILGMHENPSQQRYLELYKLGSGPFYCLYTPYHLCHFEVPFTVARAALFGDAAIAPLGAPCVDVVTAAKIDLEQGEVLDGFGQFMTYGLCENADITCREGLLPIGLAEGSRLKRSIRRDEVITYDDVELPGGRLSERLRREQDRYFGLEH